MKRKTKKKKKGDVVNPNGGEVDTLRRQGKSSCVNKEGILGKRFPFGRTRSD